LLFAVSSNGFASVYVPCILFLLQKLLRLRDKFDLWRRYTQKETSHGSSERRIPSQTTTEAAKAKIPNILFCSSFHLISWSEYLSKCEETRARKEIWVEAKLINTDVDWMSDWSFCCQDCCCMTTLLYRISFYCGTGIIFLTQYINNGTAGFMYSNCSTIDVTSGLVRNFQIAHGGQCLLVIWRQIMRFKDF